MDNNIKLEYENPAASANIFSLLTYAWMREICRKAANQALSIKDVYKTMASDKSENVCDSLERNWNLELEMSKKRNTSPSLLRAIRKTFFLRYMLYGFLVFIQMVIVRPIQPIVLSIFIGLFSDGRNIKAAKVDKETEMYIYAALLVLVSIVTMFLSHHSNFLMFKTGMRIRTACCSLVYRKMLRLNTASLNQSASGYIVNLLSNDVSRFDVLSPLFHYIWIMPIQVATVTYFIWRQVGVAAFIGVGSLTIFTIPLHAYIAKLTSVLRQKIAEKSDTRIKKMVEIVSGIQVIKMYAWEESFSKVVNLIRKNEIKIIERVSYLRGVIISSFMFIERFSLYITVISYFLLGHTITADKVFSAAQFFNLLQLTMAIFYPLAISVGAETLITVSRLEEFLLMEEKSIASIETQTSKGVSLKNVQASWIPESKLLNNVSIDIPPGTLCAIVGPVGAGKSSLLQILLGELIPESGTVSVDNTVSYAAQEPWLFASTVRKNILFGKKYEPELYKKVTYACALERDFQLLPRGDRTMVGERGISLSGGQKARINLARAVYREADVYLFDDPLSAVDTHVGKHLFEECIVGYLNNKTRILVTHQLQYLKKADHIVVVNEGKIEAQGTFDELSKNNEGFTKLLIAADETDDNDNQVIVTPKKPLIRSGSSTLSDNISTVDEDEDYEEKVVKSGAIVYWQFARAGGNLCGLLVLAISIILSQVISNGNDLWLSYWTNQEAERDNLACNMRSEENDAFLQIVPLNNSVPHPNKDIHFYETINGTSELHKNECDNLLDSYVALYVYTGLIISCVIVLSFRSLFFVKVTMSASKTLHNKMFIAILHAPMRFFDLNPSGRILNRFSRDVGIIDEILPRIMMEALQILCVMVGILVLVFITNIYMIAVALVLAIFFYKLQKVYITVVRQLRHFEGIAKSPVFSHLSASLNGVVTVRACRMESVLEKEFDLHQDTHSSIWYLIICSTSSFGLWLDGLSCFFMIALTFGFALLNKYGQVSGSSVGLAVSQSMILTGMVQYGIRQAAEVISQMTCAERVIEYTKLEKEQPQKTPEDVVIPKSWPSTGAITFEKMCLKYNTVDTPVLKNLSFVVKAGEKIGIVGRTGAGKSSLITALFKLAILEGKIIIDDIDIHNLGLNDLRKRISIIPQEPVLFSATLRYNLDPFEEFSDEALWKALEEVELKDIAESLDFYVMESGSNFSVGQRQLLCLARAILRNNKILVLDEATANVDHKTDTLIQQTIRHKFKECTVLTIAHRLNTVMDSDKVLVMDAGRVVEYNHPFLLLQNSSGYLYRMIAQTGQTMTAMLHNIAKSSYLETLRDEEENTFL